MNTARSAGQRAQLLLKASSLDQELRWLGEQPANQPANTTFSGVTYPAQLPCTPNVTYTDGPDTVRGSTGVTGFPAQIGLAASWNTNLAYDKGKAQGDEAFRKGKNVVLGPGVSSGRTPLAGRTPEYLGEDSLLGGTLAAAQTNGLQKGNPDRPTMAVLKHYIGNEQELDRQTSSSNVDERTLREVYDLPFEVAIDGSSPGGVMCSYNQVNDTYACENPLLTDNLKKQLGFDGYVVSDFGAVHSTTPSLKAGLDQELNRPLYYTPDKLKAALSADQITRKQIDEAAYRVVKAYIKNGLFDHPLPSTPEDNVSTAAHKQVAQQIATEGSVLLKNDGNVLPLSSKAKTIAVIGQTASNTPTNGVSAATVCGMSGFGAGSCTTPPVAPLDAITARAAKTGASVIYDNGSDPAVAAATAAKADVAIVFGYSKMGEGSDRTNLNLDGNGDALISAVGGANHNTIAVLETGTAALMPWQKDVKGILEAWYPGEQQGTAIARLLWGDDNPSGRLPMTFPKSLADLPTQSSAQYPGVFADGSTTRPAGDTSIRQVNYTEGLAVGYKWYEENDIAPLYAFGYGLSYTSFSYRDLSVQATKQGIEVSYEVTNTGRRAGTDTGQVYVMLPKAAGEPGKRLAAFQQVELRPGQHKKVKVTIARNASDHPLSIWNSHKDAWTTPSGTYTVEAGSSSADLPLKKTTTLR